MSAKLSFSLALGSSDHSWHWPAGEQSSSVIDTNIQKMSRSEAAAYYLDHDSAQDTYGPQDLSDISKEELYRENEVLACECR